MNFKSFFTLDKLLVYIWLPLLVIFCGFMYRKYAWLPQDNPIEEVAEDLIEKYTGKDIDLSPDTPEQARLSKKGKR